MKRHHTSWLALILLIAWLAVSAVLLVTAYGNAKHGRQALQSAQKLVDAGSYSDTRLDGQLKTAAAQLHAAHSKLANPLLAPFRLIPVGGRQLSSAIALADTGERVSSAASTALTKTRALQPTAKTDRVATLTQLNAIATEAQKRIGHPHLGPNKGLATPLAKVHNDVAKNLFTIQDGLERMRTGTEAAASLFRDNGRYLVIAANNSEARSGSGMFLSAGVLQTGNGAITLGDMQTVGKHEAPKGSVQWPQQLQDNWGWMLGQNELRNLMLSPRFDVSAPLAAEVWSKAGQGDVDGVLVIDPVILHAVLAATGPLSVDDQTVTADNVIATLLYDQYKILNGTATAQSTRRELLSDVASAAFKRLDSGDWDPITLAQQIGKAANGRHLLLWAKDPRINADWQRAGVGGELYDDSLMLNIANTGGNKLDYFLSTDATVQRKSATEMDITVKLHNTVPSNAPQYVAGPYPGSDLQKGEYDGMLTFSLPAKTKTAAFDPSVKTAINGPDGPTNVIGTEVRVPAGATTTVTLHLSFDQALDHAVVESSARTPATSWHDGAATWKDDHQHLISW